MIRKKRLYSRPKKLYVKSRIKDENQLVERYALKSKREIWKAQAKINYFRSRAMELARSSHEEQQVLFAKLRAVGLKADNTADVLALKVEELLERRLPSVIVKKGLAKTPQEARQMVAHRRVLISGNVVSIPSYIVPVSEESQIKLNAKAKKPAPAPKEVEA